jgi:hydrogenase maturation protein HypF
LKNTICLSRDNTVFVSQHIGDLENLATLQVFEHTIRHLQTINQISPQYVIYDLHPDYLSTQWALENMPEKCHGVQHHYAHILSVMAESGLTEPVIGVALDGTGFGTDGTIWGGEILVSDVHTFKRVAHFEKKALPGGEKAINEPWRMAVSYLLQGSETDDSPAINSFPGRIKEIKILKQMIEKGINSPQTSSCGRLFDAVAALLGLKTEVAYEGQAAVVLEHTARKSDSSKLPDIGNIIINKTDNIYQLCAGELIDQIVQHKQQGSAVSPIAMAFHQVLISGLLAVVSEISVEYNIKKVALSGGCFQNMILLSGLHSGLEARGLSVYINRQVPANDGGISLGQAYWGMINCAGNQAIE